MSRNKELVLAHVMRFPGCNVRDICDATALPHSTVSGHLKVLRDDDRLVVLAHPTVKLKGAQGARYIVSPDRHSEVLDRYPECFSLKLGAHSTKRFHPSLHTAHSERMDGDNPFMPGVFDIKSIIHAAVVTDAQLIIQDWSLRFEALVESTTPWLIKKLHDRSLPYIAKEGETSWFGCQTPRPILFDWDFSTSKSAIDACFDQEIGIFAKIASDGEIDGLPIQLSDTEGNPKYMEIYIAPQRSFYGFQSILMNVSERVVSAKLQYTKESQWQFFHHQIRTPLQRLMIVKDDMEEFGCPSQKEFDEYTNKISSIVEDISAHMASFPIDDIKERDVPVLAQLSDAIGNVGGPLSAGTSDTHTLGGIKINSQSLANNFKRYLTRTIPSLQYAALHSFLSNACIHGRSDAGIEVEFFATRHANDRTQLQIRIVDYGPGVTGERLEKWNEEAVLLGPADTSHLGRYGGRRLAIMGIKTGSGTVRFDHTDKVTGAGITITIELPVFEVAEKSDQIDLVEAHLGGDV